MSLEEELADVDEESRRVFEGSLQAALVRALPQFGTPDAFRARVSHRLRTASANGSLRAAVSLVQSLSSRQSALEELARSEAHYSSELRSVQENFYTPLCNKQLLPAEQMAVIFTCLPHITGLHEEFARELASAVEQPHLPMAETLMELLELLDVYVIYCASIDRAITVVYEERRTNRRFASFLERVAASRRSDDLQSVLQRPLEHIRRLPELIERLRLATPDEHEDKSALAEAHRRATRLLADIEWRRSQADRQLLCSEYFERLEGADRLARAGRLFVREGAALLLKSGRRKEVTLLLFDDLLLVTAASKKRTSARRPLRLKESVALETATTVRETADGGFEVRRDGDGRPLCFAPVAADARVADWPALLTATIDRRRHELTGSAAAPAPAPAAKALITASGGGSRSNSPQVAHLHTPPQSHSPTPPAVSPAVERSKSPPPAAAAPAAPAAAVAPVAQTPPSPPSPPSPQPAPLQAQAQASPKATLMARSPAALETKKFASAPLQPRQRPERTLKVTETETAAVDDSGGAGGAGGAGSFSETDQQRLAGVPQMPSSRISYRPPAANTQTTTTKAVRKRPDLA